MTLQDYVNLKEKADELVSSGKNGLDPVVRSIIRKMCKIYSSLSKEDKAAADFIDNIYFS